MITLVINIAVIVLLSLVCTQSVVKHERKIYAAMLILQGLQIIYILYPNLGKFAALQSIMQYFISGTFATALFIVVMFTGALDNTMDSTRKLKRVRKIWSIAASLAVLFHILYYLYYYNRIDIYILVSGFLAFVIMVPLCITSFNRVKRRIGGRWFITIQRYAYLFYAMLFFHIVFAHAAKRQMDVDKLALYIVIFTVYTGLRLHKHLALKRARH